MYLSFQYGSDSPDIKNPFKQEGLLYLIGGAVVLVISLFAILSVRSNIIENGLAFGWKSLVVGLILVTAGVNFLAKGLFKISRFYVGRGVPSSLSKNMARSEKHTDEPNVYYNSNEIEQMIMGRKNLTFHEPVTLFERLVYGVFPKFIFLPISMRNYLHILIRNTGSTIIVLFIYLLALLSGGVGLTKLTESSFSHFLGIGVCIYLLLMWLRTPLSVKKVTHRKLFFGSNSQIVWVSIIAILAPAIAEVLLRQGVKFPAAPFNPTLALITILLLSIVICTVGFMLAKLRANITEPITEVSEDRNHWSENVHPKDFFRALDMEMAEFRYKEIPNRVYRELNPTLNMEGSMDKGSFQGDMIQETQPIFQEKYYPPLLERLRFGIAVVGHSFVILSALLLFIFSQGMNDGFSIHAIFNLIFFPGILSIIGISLLTLAHLYWGEMLFKSYLIQFQGEGTYSESKLSVGMAITDSVRSENTVVRTSYSSWFLVTELLTSTQARSGTNTLSSARYILSMYKSDEMLNQLVEQIKGFLDNRELIAVSGSEQDGESIKSLYAINAAKPDNTQKLAGIKQKVLPNSDQE